MDVGRSILAINNRYKALQTVSAGIDSRILLVASKGISDDIHFYISTMNILKPTHMDIKTPKLLMESLELNFDVFNNVSPLREKFKSTLKNNVSMVRILPKTLTIQYELDNYDSHINVNDSEIARMYYGDIGYDKIDALYLVDVLGYKSYDYVINDLKVGYILLIKALI